MDKRIPDGPYTKFRVEGHLLEGVSVTSGVPQGIDQESGLLIIRL
jgi:hypothetical protein